MRDNINSNIFKTSQDIKNSCIIYREYVTTDFLLKFCVNRLDGLGCRGEQMSKIEFFLSNSRIMHFLLKQIQYHSIKSYRKWDIDEVQWI